MRLSHVCRNISVAFCSAIVEYSGVRVLLDGSRPPVPRGWDHPRTTAGSRTSRLLSSLQRVVIRLICAHYTCGRYTTLESSSHVYWHTIIFDILRFYTWRQSSGSTCNTILYGELQGSDTSTTTTTSAMMTTVTTILTCVYNDMI